MQRPTELLAIINCLQKQLWKRFNKYVKSGYHIDSELQSNKSALCFAVETGCIKAVERILRFNPNIESSSNRNSIIYVLNLNEIKSKEITRLLFQYGFKLSPEHLKNYDLLNKAFNQRNEEFVEHFLNNSDASDIVANCNFLLLSAIGKQMWKVSKQSIKLGININLVDSYGRTPLINCLSVYHFSKTEPDISNHKKVIEVLLEQPDIDVTIIDNDGRSALNYIFYGQVFADVNEETKIEITKLFLRKGVNLNAQNGGVPFLHDAVRSNSAKIVKFLLACNVNVNAIDKNGQTAFHLSLSLFRRPEVTNIFLEQEINLNSQNEYGQSLLFTVCFSTRNDKVLQTLLEKNVDVYEINNNGETALHAICDSIRNEDIASFQLLMNYKPKINHINENGCTPLHYAAGGCCEVATRMLLENGAKINIEDNEGKTALDYALMRERDNNVCVLLEHGAKVNFPDRKCCAPLVYAIQCGYIKIIESLLKFGADPNTKDSSGKTVLQIACKKGLLKAVEPLLLYGADFNVTDEKGETPLSAHLSTPDDSFDEYESPYYDNDAALVLFHHIIKMKAINCHVSEKNLNTFEKVNLDYNEDWENFLLECEEELKYLKKKISGTNISYFDLIVLNINEFETHVRNRSIRKELSLILEDEECYYYTNIISTKLVQAEFRNNLLDTSFKILCDLFQNLPSLCIEKILTYLAINDLLVLHQISGKKLILNQ